MTDAELAASAAAHLKATTITYPDWANRVKQGRYSPPDGSGTEWGKAFAALNQIQAAAPAPAPAPSDLLWVGNYPPAGMPSATTFPSQSYVPGHASIVDDPKGKYGKVLRYDVADGDRPYTGATNPRADFESPGYVKPGDHAWVLIQPGFFDPLPPLPPPFYQWAEVYGPPHAGSPPIGLGIDQINGVNRYVCATSQRYGYGRFWIGPPVDSEWHDCMVNLQANTMKADGTANPDGYVEIYWDGVIQKLQDADGSGPMAIVNNGTRADFVDLDPNIDWDGTHPNFLNINQYRRAGLVSGTLRSWHGVAAIGKTRASVEQFAYRLH